MRRFAPTAVLDPLRYVDAPSGRRYDTPDLDVLDSHVLHLHRRAASARARGFHNLATYFSTDADCLLDRRRWMTLPVMEA